MGRKKTVLMVFVVSALVLFVEYLVASGMAFDEGKGKIRKFSFVTADDLVSTGSSSFVEVPDMTVNIKTRRRGPVIIRFCGASNTDGTGGSMRVKAQLDGVDVSFAEIQFAVESVRLPHCFTWVAPDVLPGIHTATILWYKVGGGTAFVQARSLVVEGR